jgi:CRP-like cAMP-binding protein
MRLRKDVKIELIRRVPLFERCSKGELQEVAAVADEIDLPEGRVLTRQGEPGREFLVLVDGSAEVVQDGRTINQLGKGDFLGEIALLSDRPRTATVTATSPVRALVVRDVEFRSLLAHQPALQAKLLATLADRIAHDSL